MPAAATMAPDPKALRRYHAGVERALGLFDTTNEWADYIAFLSRLTKALQASPPGADVPFEGVLAKYLALCLKPSLPSGVHQKALEVYHLVFSLLGRDGLSRDLAVWLPGVSHTLTFASLGNRPLFLSLYDDHLLHLSSAVLRPALRAIILSLLPGIEEEHSEDFDRSMATFARLRRIFEHDGAEDFFWQCLFLASITSTTKRPGVLVYLTRHLPRLGRSTTPAHSAGESKERHLDDMACVAKAVATPEPGLLVRCFATGLQDEQALVQRGFLDLLVSHLPLNAPVLQEHVSAADLDILTTAALSVVLRRDMSLNRRLWAWFIGREDNRDGAADDADLEEPPTPTDPARDGLVSHYFAKYGLPAVVRSLKHMLGRTSSAPADRARPFRILLSLMDRWIIGKAPVEALFIPAMLDLQAYQTTAPSQASFDEVFRSANVFFDAIEPQLIAGQLFRLLQERNLNLVEFILLSFNLQENDMLRLHLPLLALITSDELLRAQKSPSNGARRTSSVAETEDWSELLQGIMILLPPQPPDGPRSSAHEQSRDTLMETVKTAYQPSGSKTFPGDHISPHVVASVTLHNVALAFLGALSLPDQVPPLGALTTALLKAISRVDRPDPLRELGFSHRLMATLQQPSSDALTNYEATRSVARVVETLVAFDHTREILTDYDLLTIVPALVTCFWNVLLPATPQFHVEAVEQIWSLRLVSGHLLLVDSQISEFMAMPGPTTATCLEERMSRFATLWMHTRFPEVNVELFSSDQGIDPAETPWVLLRQPVLSIVDGLELAHPDDPRRLWMINLASILPIFHIALADLRAASNPQLAVLGLHRLQKIVAVVRQSSVLRRELFDANSMAEMLVDVCLERLASAATESDAATLALSILRVVIEETDVRDVNALAASLMHQLSQMTEDSRLQEHVLDTLHALFARPNRGPPEPELLTLLMAGISARGIDRSIDKWITLLCNTISIYPTPTLFANLLKLTACFCRRITSYFEAMQRLYEKAGADHASAATGPVAQNPERSISNLLAGLEYILARAHSHLGDSGPGTTATPTSTNDLSLSRTIANNRLTVVLCMQDTIKLCGDIWAWKMQRRAADTKSYAYTSSKLRLRTRRILEHLADAEPQECLETLMGMWVVAAARRDSAPDVTLNLMQSLDGARPKFMMPATFNAIYNRTNPTALDPSQKSSLSVDVTAPQLMAFLIAYTQALEDDLLEEIWTDCTAFLREVLANPMPHRQILLQLLEFVSIVCQKMENTNFGELSRMRRELGDLCARLFTAILTIRPAGLDSMLLPPGEARASESSAGGRKDGSTHDGATHHGSTKDVSTKGRALGSGSAIEIICDALPIIGSALGDLDRLTTTLSGLAVNITGPALRSKQFPQTVTSDLLRLVQLMAQSQPGNKAWKKDVLDAYNDSRFFQCPASLAETGWMPLLKQVSVADKGVMVELLARLTPPTTAGLMFGVGATAARTEADKRTQLNLRRVALLLLAGDVDAFLPDMGVIVTKLEELLTATSTSSPSSRTRGDVYVVFRAMALSFHQPPLASLWPIIDVELRALLTSIQPGAEAAYTDYSQIQGAKLLDLLLLLKPEEFQLHEWLFITDTIDAVHPPNEGHASALADGLVISGVKEVELPSVAGDQRRTPWLCSDVTRATEDAATILRPFFRQLSIHAFEDTYSLQKADRAACRRDLVEDLFVD